MEMNKEVYALLVRAMQAMDETVESVCIYDAYDGSSDSSKRFLKVNYRYSEYSYYKTIELCEDLDIFTGISKLMFELMLKEDE